jgi:hypothetical protein
VTLKEDPVLPCPQEGGFVIAVPVFKNQMYVVYKITKNTPSAPTSLP